MVGLMASNRYQSIDQSIDTQAEMAQAALEAAGGQEEEEG